MSLLFVVIVVTRNKNNRQTTNTITHYLQTTAESCRPPSAARVRVIISESADENGPICSAFPECCSGSPNREPDGRPAAASAQPGWISSPKGGRPVSARTTFTLQIYSPTFSSRSLLVNIGIEKREKQPDARSPKSSLSSLLMLSRCLIFGRQPSGFKAPPPDYGTPAVPGSRYRNEPVPERHGFVGVRERVQRNGGQIKRLKPSNHATIQSLVHAIGLNSRVPGPCCVPEKLAAVTLLYFDENKNVVLKNYPEMSVESCSCR
ncbi:hypothetical protein LSH36_201g03038 [Paralvinella palmiformis]|uniref:TGF-beta family profile domain-containing protein n=1 Tax=Paralvinella palmiformis TaxID=53620 RepID=A0AAD9N4N6_9ANNE|nr:hypothetical protein LSH36_201g03038 [Paralvinella palmiformis]